MTEGKKHYYAVGHVVVVEAESAEAAFEKATPPGPGELSEDGNAYVGVVFSGPACPITPPMAGDPDWQVQLFYGATEMQVATGAVLPLMDADAADQLRQLHTMLTQMIDEAREAQR